MIDAKITPQNRIIICQKIDYNDASLTSKVDVAHARLARAYHRAHDNNNNKRSHPPFAERMWKIVTRTATPAAYIGLGFFLGILTSFGQAKRKS